VTDQHTFSYHRRRDLLNEGQSHEQELSMSPRPSHRRPGPKRGNYERFREIVARVPDWESNVVELASELDKAGEEAPRRRVGDTVDRHKSWKAFLGKGTARQKDNFRKAVRLRLKQ